jgi:hypothetical protein
MTPEEKITELKAKVDQLLDKNISLQNDILYALSVCDANRGNPAIELIYKRLQK